MPRCNRILSIALTVTLAPMLAAQQTPSAPTAANPQPTLAEQAAAVAPARPVSAVPRPFHVAMPHSHNPFAPYRPSAAPPVSLDNSPLLADLERNGKLHLSLEDAIALALEDNLDLAYFRYNLPIAQTDLARTKAGGVANGVNTGIIQGPAGGFGSGTPANAASNGAGVAGAGAAGAGGLVTSTLGAGSAITPFDPQILVQGLVDHTTQTEINTVNFGVPVYKQNTVELYSSYSQAFPLGTNFSVSSYGIRQTTNSIFNILNPELTTNFNVTINQPLLQGFGLATNERYIHIARKNLKITDLAFKAQVIATITEVEDLYWDLVNAYEDAQVKQHSLDYAQETLRDDQEQLKLENIPAMQVLKDQSAVATSEAALTVAKANLRLNQLLLINVLTKTINGPTLANIPIIPLDLTGAPDPDANKPIRELIVEAEKNRPDVSMDQLAMQNAQASLRSIKNELLPSLTLYGEYVGSGFGGLVNPNCKLGPDCSTSLPGDFAGAFENTFNYSSPEYQVGFKLDITLRNRIAKADQFRAVLEYRQRELRYEQQKKSIRLDVRNSQYALEQARAEVVALTEARNLARKTFDIAKQEEKLGAISRYDTLSADQSLAVAQSALFAARADFEKAKVDIDRATGSTLARTGVSLDEAKSGVVNHMP